MWGGGQVSEHGDAAVSSIYLKHCIKRGRPHTPSAAPECLCRGALHSPLSPRSTPPPPAPHTSLSVYRCPTQPHLPPLHAPHPCTPPSPACLCTGDPHSLCLDNPERGT